MTPLLAALASGDVDAFDREVEALGGARPMLAALLEGEEEGAPFGGDLDVSALAASGPRGLWRASAWVLRVVPGAERRAPLPVHEQWDALIEIHRARPEAAWLVIELLASLTVEQRALGRRVALGIARRFGERGRRIARARLAMGDVPLHDLLAGASPTL